MLSKLFAQACLTALAGFALVSALPTPEEHQLRARASGGGVVFYQNTNYGGSYVDFQLNSGSTSFCTRFDGPGSGTGASFTQVGSYISSDLGCYTWPSDDCSGNSDGYIAVSCAFILR